ncbi:Predicted arabinose efflux permease, MFS family [Arsukibacterium tuosuense]|uniref:Predicted arabinose efflux permease, MFS family n=1 Tax=Arsukibacterium tuosuense TaxID=1323745 RepID=A0A285IMQ7_9GAMM|nr:MFS transporter [Arsukibacterium tuosuense]SNY49234.1 Predicted arabinose efflux permease, MFS family [Arsukibacterium tuosuense]
MDQLNAIEKRAALALALVFLTRMLGLFMLLPVFALYGTELIGYSPLWIGLAIGAYGLTQAILQIPFGWLSDRIGRHKVMLLGLALFVLGSVVAALADSVYMVTFGRILQGAGAIAGAVLALAADLTRDEQRPKVMAIIGASIGLSFALAMVAGPLLAKWAGLSGVFWFTAVLACCAMLIVALLVPKSVSKAPAAETLAVPATLLNIVRHRQLLQLDIGVLLLHLMLTAMFVALPLLLSQYQLAADQHWLVYLPVLLGSFVLMVPMMIIAMRRQQEKGYFLVAISLLIIAMLLAFIATDLWWLIAALLIFFTGFNFLEASLPAMVSRVAPAGQRGSAMGIYSSSQFFGAFAGGLIGGLIAQHFSYGLVFAVLAGIGLIWLLIARTMQVPARAQRLSLAVQVNSEQEASVMAGRLAELSGVQEVTILLAEQRCYLKVSSQQFDLAQARTLVGTSQP